MITSHDATSGSKGTASNQFDRPAHSTAAFTLIELLVASAVSLLLVAVLLNATSSVLSVYRTIGGSIIRNGDISFALDQVILDLESLVVPSSLGAEALRVTPDTVGGLDSQWLTFLTSATDKDNSGTVLFTGATRAVSYRMAFQNPVDGGSENPVFALYRSISSARHAFQNALGQQDLQTGYWTQLSASPAPTPRHPTHTDSFLAGNVVGFNIRFLRSDNGNWTQPADTITIARDGVKVNDVQIPGGFERAEVSITALTPEGSQRVANGEFALSDAVSRHRRTSIRQTAFLGQ